MEILKSLKEGILGIRPKEQERFTLPNQDSMKRALEERAGTDLFRSLDRRAQRKISEVLAWEDESGLRELVDQFGRDTVKQMASAADGAAKGVMKEKTSYRKWVDEKLGD